MSVTRRSIAYIVAPHEENGGGMGRIKDTIVLSPDDTWDGLVTRQLVTRNGAGRIGSLLLVLRACAAIVRARLDGSLALVHVNRGDRGSAVRKGLIVVFARLVGAPTFLHLHAVMLERDLAGVPRFLRPLATLPFRVATCVIVLGERWRHWLRDEIGITGTPIEVLVNGVPLEAPAARDHSNTSGRVLKILFLGNLIARKGIDDLITALALLPADSKPWTVTFAGYGDVAPYRAAAERGQIGERVDFAGWVDHSRAQAMVADADLLVLPSYDEGLPLVVLEALGLGTPVITTPVGAMPEFLRPVDVVFCPPGDPIALAAAISRVLSDPQLRQSLCDHGLDAFHRQFSVTAFRAHLLQIWRRDR